MKSYGFVTVLEPDSHGIVAIQYDPVHPVKGSRSGFEACLAAMFGEVTARLLNEWKSASWGTHEDGLVLDIDKATFEYLLSEDPKVLELCTTSPVVVVDREVVWPVDDGRAPPEVHQSRGDTA